MNVFLWSIVGVVLIGMAATTFTAWIRLRRARVNRVVDALALLVGQSLPLVPGLRAAARDESKRAAGDLAAVAEALSRGDSLSTAIRVSVPVTPAEILGTIQAGELAGSLPTALRSIVRERDARDEPRAVVPPWLLYVNVMMAVLGVGLLPFGFLGPRFRDIFADFGGTLPPLTREMFMFSGVGPRLMAPLLAIGALLTFILVLLCIARQFIMRVPDRVQPAYRTIDLLLWCLPGVRQVSSHRALARQLPILQASVRSGQDVSNAARHAACVDANHYARERLRRFAGLVERGTEPAAAAREAGLPLAVRNVLAAARDGHDLAGGLDYLASYYRSLVVHWERMLEAILMPLAVLAFAAVVLPVLLAAFLPMVSLIDALVAGVY